MPRSSCEGFIPVKKKWPIIFVVNTSESMEPNVEKTIEVINFFIRMVSTISLDVDLDISVVTFFSDCEWIVMNQPDDYRIKKSDLGSYKGYANISLVLEELNRRLSRTELLSNSLTGYFAPVVLFITNNIESASDYNALNQLKSNRWYVCVIKVGILMEQSKECEILEMILGNKDFVLSEDNYHLLERIFIFEQWRPGREHRYDLLDIDTYSDIDWEDDWEWE